MLGYFCLQDALRYKHNASARSIPPILHSARFLFLKCDKLHEGYSHVESLPQQLKQVVRVTQNGLQIRTRLLQ